MGSGAWRSYAIKTHVYSRDERGNVPRYASERHDDGIGLEVFGGARHRNVMTMGSDWMYLATLGIGTS